MAIISRGIDDLALDAYVAKLTAWQAAQKAITAAAAFDTARDTPEWWTTTVPLVDLTCDTDDFEPKGSDARIVRQARITFKAICIAPLAASRLYYLKQQALAGLFSLDAPHIETSLGVGKLSAGWPSWSRIAFEDREFEKNVFAGAWTWQASYSWEADETTPPALSDVSIDAARWTALYHFA